MRRRNFKVGEANALLPHLREVLEGIQSLRDGVGECTDQIKILDVIWGRGDKTPPADIQQMYDQLIAKTREE